MKSFSSNVPQTDLQTVNKISNLHIFQGAQLRYGMAQFNPELVKNI